MRTFLYCGAWLLTLLSIAAPPFVLVAAYNWTLVLRWDAQDKARRAKEVQRVEARRRRADAERLRAIRSLLRY